MNESLERLPLTSREKEVVHQLLQGKANSHIADTLKISLNTVKTHLKHIFSKMEVSSRQELIIRLLADRLRTSN